MVCFENNTNQESTRQACPQTDGKAERVIRALMQCGWRRNRDSDELQGGLWDFIKWDCLTLSVWSQNNYPGVQNLKLATEADEHEPYLPFS